MEVGDKITISIQVVARKVIDRQEPCVGCCFYHGKGACDSVAYGIKPKCRDKEGNEFIFQIADSMKINIKDLMAKVLSLQPEEKIYIECVGRQYGITFLKVFNSSMYVCSDLDSKFSSVLLDSCEDMEYWLKGCVGGEYAKIICDKDESQKDK